MQMLKCRTAYNARDEEHKGVIFPSDSLVQRHFQQECDVNFIVDRYVKTGVLSHVSEIPPVFADVSDVPDDLMQSYDKIYAAEQAFMQLPSKLRKELDNDPARLGAWLQDENNRNAAIEYGLLGVQSQSTNVETNESSKKEEKPPEA